MTTNGHEVKPSRICVRRPFSTNNFLPTSSPTSSFSSQLKKRTLQLNNLFLSKTKSHEQTNGHASEKPLTDSIEPISPPLVFLPTTPTPVEETHPLPVPTNGEQKVRQPGESSCSDDDHPSKSHRVPPCMDIDADESDNDHADKKVKSRRLQKTRKSSNASLQQKYDGNDPAQSILRNNLRKDEQQHRSSSNDEGDKYESNSILNRNNEINHNHRRIKYPATRKSHQFIAVTTTTDEDTQKHRYRRPPPSDHLNSKSAHESTATAPSSIPVPTPAIESTASMKRKNRFQIECIRKSQQQQMLLASCNAAKSSNDDDCSVPTDRSILPLRPSIIERKQTHTPTTDAENSIANTVNPPKGTHTTFDTIKDEQHHVTFQVTSHGKQEPTADGEKAPVPSAVVTAVPNPAPASSSQREEDEEEEAIAKSPDGRFIKYAKEIGRGAFKTVYRGLDTEASVPVAWCELQDFAQFDKHERARFKEEAAMLKKLQHQNIVRFYDFWEETNPRTNKKVIILVTELMTSGSLKGYIRKFKGQKEDKRINVMKKWCRQILKGLAYLHSRNPPVIHRDLKCDNVFISSTTGCVKIGDLGLATFKTQTFAKSMRGTMEFMAPEMFDEKYDELVDIYSFGLCMLEMIIGEYPYVECKGPTAVIKRVTAGQKPDCYYRVENEDVREVIDCCIRTKKEERLSVHDLLQHSFFLDDNGLRIDRVRDPSDNLQMLLTNDYIDLKLKITDKSKRKAPWTEHEAIRFRYNLLTDTAEQIADELIEKKYIFDDEKNFVIQSIKDRLRAYNYELLDRQAGVYCRDRKPPAHPTPQSSVIGQPTPLPQPIPTTPLQPQSYVTPVVSIAPTTPLARPSLDELQTHQTMKASLEPSQTKQIVITDSAPVTPLSDLNSTVTSSAGSLEVLDAALKKTFNKSILSQSTGATMHDNGEPSTPLLTQDDLMASRSAHSSAGLSEPQQTRESDELISTDLLTNAFQSSTSVILQTQSQPSTMLHHCPPPASINASVSTQTSHSCSYPANASSSSQPNATPFDDATKPLLPTSFSTTETIDSSRSSISPSFTSETLQPTIVSDAPATVQPPLPGSLKQLDALLKNTFKSSGKSTGTAHNSDTETGGSVLPSIPITINDGKAISTDLFDQSAKCQPADFDPLISPQRDGHLFDALLKTPYDKSVSSNDDTIVASSANDLSEIKSLILDLNRSLLKKMSTIEQKIDDHRNQTKQINHLLTDTILPSLTDLTDILQGTSTHLDARIRTKLDNIRMNIRTSQEQTEMKDLMEI